MLRFLIKLLFGSNKRELEAKLLPVEGSGLGGFGEIEANVYDNGKVALELSLKHSGVSDGANLEYFISGIMVGQAVSNMGYAKIYKRIDKFESDISRGSSAELRINGKTMYVGEFRPD